MPIQVSAAWQEKIATVTVEFDGDTATIDYKINRITSAMVSKVTGSTDIDVLTTALSSLIVRWDVLGEPVVTEQAIAQAMNAGLSIVPLQGVAAPTMYPTDPASLAQLPLAFLSAVTEAIFGSIAPKSRTTGKR